MKIKKIVFSIFVICSFLATYFSVYADIYSDVCLGLNRTIKRGDKGEDVKLLQKALTEEGIAYISPNGFFGPQTELAVKEFQRRFGILTNGKVGPVTLSKMKLLWCEKSETLDTPKTVQNIGSEIPSAAELSLSKKQISLGESVNVAWNTTGMAFCVLNGSDLNVVGLSGTQVIYPKTDTFFYLNCRSQSGEEIYKNVSVKVLPELNFNHLLKYNYTLSTINGVPILPVTKSISLNFAVDKISNEKLIRVGYCPSSNEYFKYSLNSTMKLSVQNRSGVMQDAYPVCTDYEPMSDTVNEINEKVKLALISNPSIYADKNQIILTVGNGKFIFKKTSEDMNADVLVAVTSDKLEYQVGEKINLRVEIKNISQTDIQLSEISCHPYYGNILKINNEDFYSFFGVQKARCFDTLDTKTSLQSGRSKLYEFKVDIDKSYSKILNKVIPVNFILNGNSLRSKVYNTNIEIKNTAQSIGQEQYKSGVQFFKKGLSDIKSTNNPKILSIDDRVLIEWKYLESETNIEGLLVELVDVSTGNLYLLKKIKNPTKDEIALGSVDFTVPHDLSFYNTLRNKKYLADNTCEDQNGWAARCKIYTTFSGKTFKIKVSYISNTEGMEKEAYIPVDGSVLKTYESEMFTID